MSDFRITVRNSEPLRLEGDRSGFASACEAAELPPPRPRG
jgi:hypothetical protein